jgi:hypothetical protein
MNDTPAFPVCDAARIHDLQGMTLRDYFAAKALANKYTQNATMPDKVAEWAYVIADAMLKAREQ